MNLFRKINTSKRHGLSLLEVLVGLTITLIVLLAMTQAFKFASQQMSIGRASVELTNRLRTAESLLRNDLERLTLSPRSYHDAAAEPKGYFELVDGFATDTNNFFSTFASPPTDPIVISNMQEMSIRSLAMGDYDDLWCGTIRTDSQPFRGRNGTAIEESHLAEVIWYTVANDLDDNTFIEVTERVDLFRRVLLVKPDAALIRADGTAMPATFPTLALANAARSQYLQSSDISVAVGPAPGGTFRVFANSLDSLTFRNNRFFTATHGLVAGANDAERRLNYRNGLRYLKASDFGSQAAFVTAQGLRLRSLDNQNLLLNDVLAFDLQVFDPEVTVGVDFDGASKIQSIVEPSDAGFENFNGLTAFITEGTTGTSALGGYVDLRSTVAFGAGQFGGISNALRFTDQVYDTGTPLYDRNNINDDPADDALIDEGGDGIDNDSDGLIDEADEKEVPPNFTDPIKGLSIRIRLIEPTTGQVSQATIKKSF